MKEPFISKLHLKRKEKEKKKRVNVIHIKKKKKKKIRIQRKLIINKRKSNKEEFVKYRTWKFVGASDGKYL